MNTLSKANSVTRVLAADREIAFPCPPGRSLEETITNIDFSPLEKAIGHAAETLKGIAIVFATLYFLAVVLLSAALLFYTFSR